MFDRALHQFAWTAARLANGSSLQALTFSRNLLDSAESLGAADAAAEGLIAEIAAEWAAGAIGTQSEDGSN